MSRKDMKNRRQEKIRHIIKAATGVFAAKGYAGASTNEIANVAGISKRSMYYYVGDKDTLYATVVKDMLDEIYGTTNVTLEEGVSSEQKLYAFIKSMAQIGNNRQFHSIVVRELLSGGEFLPEDIPESLDRMSSNFADVIDQGKEQSGFGEINPVIASLSLLSFFVYWNLCAPIMINANKRTEDLKRFGSYADDALVDEVYKMFVKLLQKS